jgi:hypothetical protein
MGSVFFEVSHASLDEVQSALGSGQLTLVSQETWDRLAAARNAPGLAPEGAALRILLEKGLDPSLKESASSDATVYAYQILLGALGHRVTIECGYADVDEDTGPDFWDFLFVEPVDDPVGVEGSEEGSPSLGYYPPEALAPWIGRFDRLQNDPDRTKAIRAGAKELLPVLREADRLRHGLWVTYLGG